MSDKDINVQSTGFVPQTVPIIPKPPWLIFLKTQKKQPKFCLSEYFISLEKPLTEGNLLNCKGLFVDKTEDEILKNWQGILTSYKKEDIIELSVPVNEIFLIRNLGYKSK